MILLIQLDFIPLQFNLLMATGSALLSFTDIRHIYFLGYENSYARKNAYALLPNLFALNSENIFTDLVSLYIQGWKQVVE